MVQISFQRVQNDKVNPNCIFVGTKPFHADTHTLYFSCQKIIYVILSQNDQLIAVASNLLALQAKYFIIIGIVSLCVLYTVVVVLVLPLFDVKSEKVKLSRFGVLFFNIIYIHHLNSICPKRWWVAFVPSVSERKMQSTLTLPLFSPAISVTYSKT